MDHLPKIKAIHEEAITLATSFADFAHGFSQLPGTVVLLSGSDLDCARYHILGANPWLDLSARHHDVTVRFDGRAFSRTANPFDVLKQLTTVFGGNGALSDTELPISCGLMGYLAYDLKDSIEELPRTSLDRYGLPHMCLYAPSIIVVHDRAADSTRLFITEIDGSPAHALENQKAFFEKMRCQGQPTSPENEIRTGALASNFTRPDYVRAIERIIEYIASGDVYQVNMSQRFEAEFCGDPYLLFKRYFALNPAPFFAYVNAGDHQIVSTSPERFLTVCKNQVETRPIKGTRPRGKTAEEDRRMKEKLAGSRKDDAELSMIVDLMRNDIGRVCEGGSVYVDQHKRVEAYQNVYHLVSVVKGTLAPQYDAVDLIRATFPGGSITGCPKIRSMEIIDELESDRRHIYTGAIGYISFHGTMDLSIAIRTATVSGNRLSFSVGGGIVYDSDPQKEFEETLHKGQTLMTAFQGADQHMPEEQMVWQNGMLVPAIRAAVSVDDLGFQYGYGFFETIRAEHGIPKNLSAHEKRFNRTWAELFKDPLPDITWDAVIGQVLAANGLNGGLAAVKIMATKGSRNTVPYNHTLVVTARPYTHRLDGKPDAGLHLGTYPFARQTPLAGHKTMNYLYYYLAGQWAAENGRDEALVLNPDGSASETNTACLIGLAGNTVILPKSPAVLPGTMQEAVVRCLKKQGYVVKEETVLPADLFGFEAVLAANALMGAVPVLSIDGKKVGAPSDLWERLNSAVWK